MSGSPQHLTLGGFQGHFLFSDFPGIFFCVTRLHFLFRSTHTHARTQTHTHTHTCARMHTCQDPHVEPLPSHVHLNWCVVSISCDMRILCIELEISSVAPHERRWHKVLAILGGAGRTGGGLTIGRTMATSSASGSMDMATSGLTLAPSGKEVADRKKENSMANPCSSRNMFSWSTSPSTCTTCQPVGGIP